MTLDKTAIRDAATVIVLRDRDTQPRILMGQRGAKASFMPTMFVFPGGAVDRDDGDISLARPLPDLCAARLGENAEAHLPHAIAVAATGHVPDASALQFVFRAITPPGRPRRFDARFFLVDAEAIASDPDDFSAAQDELSHLQWIGLDAVRHFDMPFITEVVLAEIAARAQDDSPPASVPFFHNDDERSLFLRLRGYTPAD